MLYSVPNLPATYTVEQTLVDCRLKAGYIVRCSGRFLGYADSLADAQYAARIHASIFEGATLH